MIFDALSSFAFFLINSLVGLLPNANSVNSGFLSTVLNAFDWLGGIFAGFVYALNGIGASYATIPVGDFIVILFGVYSVFIAGYFAWRIIKWIVEIIRG